MAKYCVPLSEALSLVGQTGGKSLYWKSKELNRRLRIKLNERFFASTAFRLRMTSKFIPALC
jgi:hypothetical protein